MSFRVQVDVRNPGQFFACCGLFELAHRLTGYAEARFEGGTFLVDADCALAELIGALVSTELRVLEPDDQTSSPLELSHPFELVLDWWKDDRSGGKELKVWAGSMESDRIARAMFAALRDPRVQTEQILEVGSVVFDVDEPDKKVEPFYFDARRAPNAHSRDVGFSPNDLHMTTTAFPAVEAFCLVGLQRFRPRPTGRRRWFEYRTWVIPVPISVAGPIVAGSASIPGESRYRFETCFRTGKHKAFRAAFPIEGGE